MKIVHLAVMVFSVLAALFWLLSTVFSPKSLRDDGTAARLNANAFRDIRDLHKTLRRQSLANATAAVCATIAAFLTIFDH